MTLNALVDKVYDAYMRQDEVALMHLKAQAPSGYGFKVRKTDPVMIVLERVQPIYETGDEI
jgi:hypothetical protein